MLTGATGYVGGRLLRRLEEAGRTVHCLVRRPEVLKGRVAPATRVFQGDLSQDEDLSEAMAGVECAYYLVHSLGKTGDFEAEEYGAARRFARAAREAGVRRIIYLGGLGDESRGLSRHLRSRHQVGRILRQSGIQVIEFRTSIIIGSGSLSFELIRSLVRRLPVMITPRWVSVPAQPIAIDDVLAYLMEALETDLEESRVFEIGGADQVSYAGLMQEYARQRGVRRYIVRVPVLTPRLSSLWLHLVTPIYAAIGRKLIDGISSPTVVTEDGAKAHFSVRPMGIREAIALALMNEDREFAETHWSDARSTVAVRGGYGGIRFGSRILDVREVWVPAPVSDAFAPIRRIGGQTGWYYGQWLWKLRGLLDRFAGGVGMARGRRDRERLRVGDVVDCWRAEDYVPNRLLRLRAEMKLPGRAWLEFRVSPEDDGSRITQTATFDPKGLLGLIYWYALFPAHALVFGGMLRGIAGRVRDSRNAPVADEGRDIAMREMDHFSR